MSLALIGFIAVSLAAYALVSVRLNRSLISGPMFFTAVGIIGIVVGVGAEPTGDVTGSASLMLELTLALVLFTDAMATNVASWRGEGALPTRLLTIGMPLIIVAGALVAVGMFSQLDIVGAAILATVLAPTDAALGKPVVSNKGVPARIRAALNIESGLNDGVALPFLLFFIAVAEAEEGANLLLLLLSVIGIAVVVGVVSGWVFARLIIVCSERGWMVPIWRQIAVVVAPISVYVLAEELGGSGFIATFVAGLLFGRVVLASYPGMAEFGEDLAEVLTMVAFVIFGSLILQPAFGTFTWVMLVYAFLSLTLVRMVPVAISMIGTRLRRPSLLYMGWFGPRGLASLIFGAIVIEEAAIPNTDLITTVVTLTVGLSILLHGITAGPGARAYANWFESQGGEEGNMSESKEVESTQSRRRISRG